MLKLDLRLALTLLFLLTSSPLLQSQEVKVRNVRFFQRSDFKVLISFDLVGHPSKKYQVNISLQLPQSRRPLILNNKSLQGEVGKNVRAGHGKIILWDLNKDFPKGLHGEGFRFVINAYEQKGNKLPWILAGVAVAGGGTAFLLSTISSSSSGGGSSGVLKEPPPFPGEN